MLALGLAARPLQYSTLVPDWTWSRISTPVCPKWSDRHSAKFTAAEGIPLGGAGGLDRSRSSVCGVNCSGALALWRLAVRLRIREVWSLVRSLGAVTAEFNLASVTPAPSPTGWHGLGWRIVADPNAPISWRFGVALLASALIAMAVAPLVRAWSGRNDWLDVAWRRENLRLLIVAGILILLRQFDPPGSEPVGYWPRWAFLGGLIAFNCTALLRAQPSRPTSRWVRLGWVLVPSL